MKRKAALIAVVFLGALCFSGCVSEVEYLLVDGAETTEHIVQVKMSVEEMTLLNAWASASGVKHTTQTYGYADAAWSKGDPWTVGDYLRVLAHLTGGFTYDPAFSLGAPAGVRIFAFRRSADKTIEAGIGQDASAASVPERIASNPFIYTYEYTLPNPFNTLRAEYDNPHAGTIFDAFKNGLPGIAFPSFFEAFATADTSFFNPDNLTVDYTLVTASRYDVLDETGRKTREEASGAYFYTFPGAFDTTEREIVLRYIRPNPIGWYVTAILAGGLTVAAIIGYTRLKKGKERPDYAA